MKRDLETKQMRGRILSYVKEDGIHSLGAVLRRVVEDSIRPRTDEGRLRVSPILLLLASLSAFSIVVFIYFSVVQP